jgi:hypothetical protein
MANISDESLSQLAPADFFTVPTIWFEILSVFVVLSHDAVESSTSTLRSIRRRSGPHNKLWKRAAIPRVQAIFAREFRDRSGGSADSFTDFGTRDIIWKCFVSLLSSRASTA